MILAPSAGSNSTPSAKAEIHAATDATDSRSEANRKSRSLQALHQCFGDDPPGFPSGIIESTNAHCASVKSVAYVVIPFSKIWSAAYALALQLPELFKQPLREVTIRLVSWGALPIARGEF